MLYKSYLLSLRRLKKDNNSYGDNSPNHLRWLWCAWAAKILGWREARLDNHPNGLRASPSMPSKGLSPFKKDLNPSVSSKGPPNHYSSKFSELYSLFYLMIGHLTINGLYLVSKGGH